MCTSLQNLHLHKPALSLSHTRTVRHTHTHQNRTPVDLHFISHWLTPFLAHTSYMLTTNQPTKKKNNKISNKLDRSIIVKSFAFLSCDFLPRLTCIAMAKDHSSSFKHRSSCSSVSLFSQKNAELAPHTICISK